MSFLWKNIGLLFILLLISTTIKATKKEILFKQFSKEQGLPGDNVQSVFQDSYGYIWFGIESVGLCKFDGNRYYVYGLANTDNNSLSTSFINFMAEDDNGDLWLATEQGLNIFNRDEGVFKSYFYPDIPNNRIKTISKDKRNAIWIGTEKGAVRFIPVSSAKVQKKWFGFESRYTKYIIDEQAAIENIGNEIVNSIQEDQNGVFWFGTFNGLYKYQFNQSGKKCQKIIIDKTDITANRINDIAQLPDGNMLIGTNVGVRLFNVKTHNTSKIESDYSINNNKVNFGVTKILVDRNGVSWIGTNLNGILAGKINPPNANNVTIPTAINGLEGTHIRNIFEDRTGQIWVITKYAGIYANDPRSQLFPHYSTSTNDLNFILSACESKNGNVLLGTKFGSLLEFNIENSSIKQKKLYLNSEYLNRIECLFEDPSNNIWLGFKKGLVMLDSNKHVKKFYEAPKVYGISISPSGIFWIFTVDGVYYLNRQSDKVEKYDLSVYGKQLMGNGIIVQGIFTDKAKNLWFPTYANGIFKYDSTTNNLTWFKNEPGKADCLSGNIIRSFFEDNKGDIWIGTKFSGLNKYIPKSGSFEHKSIADGLPSNAIYSIIDDENGNLWISTNNGVSKYDLRKKQFLNFNEKHGLQGNVFESRTSIKLKNNDILFGGNNGFNLFSPEKVDIDTFSPPLVVTHILANNTTISKDLFSSEEVFIPYKKSKLITIEFSALDYRDPTSIKYAYQLEGVDKDWIFSTRHNSVTYSKVPHGKYKFRFKATNADGMWVEHDLIVNMIIETPLWLRWWAYLCYFIIGLASLFGIYHFATIRANYRHQLAIKEQELKRDKELNQMKLRFFTNISHEIRTPLTLIMAPLQKLINSTDINDSYKRKIELIDKSAKRLLKLTDQLLYFRKVQQESLRLEVTHSDIVLFLTDIISPFYELADNSTLKFDFICEYNYLTTWFDPDKIEKIISNLLSNAFKFTPENGSVFISLTKEEMPFGSKKRFFTGRDETKFNYAKISIKDSGVGMTPKQVEHIFERFYQAEPFDTGVGIGLEFVKQLVEIHKGNIEVESTPGQGTTFSIFLPLNKSVYKNEIILNEEIENTDYISKSKLTLLYGKDKNTEALATNCKDCKDKPKLLVVEDDRDLQLYLKQMLDESYNVLVANNGETGLEITKKELPEIIITDVMMPKMDGHQFCKIVKADVAVSHIPIIMLTAKNLDDDQLEGLYSGADDYISKPFNDEILMARINNIMVSRKKLQEKYSNTIYVNPAEITTNKTDEQFTERLLGIIDQDISNPELSIQDIARLLNMDRTNLFKKIKSIFGKSPSQFIREYRIKNAAKLLLQHKYNINEVSYMVGFTSPAYFSKLFKEVFGKTPSEFLNEKKHY